jgi:ATP phosphoribosyltransferase
MLLELSPQKNPSSPEATSKTAELLERFRNAGTKIAIQKDGELTQISREVLADTYGIRVPSKDSREKTLFGVSDDGEYGFVYARNKGICDLVANGAVDLAVVGTDRLFEDDVENRVEVVASFEDRYSWPLVVATPLNSDISSLSQVRRVATQYPRITQRFFESWGAEIETVPTVGSTELYAYIQYGGEPIDAIVDMSITGRSLSAHNLVPWDPSIGDIYPVLIRGQEVQSA